MIEKLVSWLFFSVILALVPLLVSSLIQVTHKQAANLETVLAHGELLLIAAGLCAASAGELIGTGSGMKILKLIAGGSAIVILVFAAIYFADIAASNQAKAVVDLGLVCDTSLTLFTCALFSSGCCIALSKV